MRWLEMWQWQMQTVGAQSCKVLTSSWEAVNAINKVGDVTLFIGPTSVGLFNILGPTWWRQHCIHQLPVTSQGAEGTQHLTGAGSEVMELREVLQSQWRQTNTHLEERVADSLYFSKKAQLSWTSVWIAPRLNLSLREIFLLEAVEVFPDKSWRKGQDNADI